MDDRQPEMATEPPADRRMLRLDAQEQGVAARLPAPVEFRARPLLGEVRGRTDAAGEALESRPHDRCRAPPVAEHPAWQDDRPRGETRTWPYLETMRQLPPWRSTRGIPPGG